ncbi:BamA/TamA family outer membrane protein [Parvularcula sp. ZS-1/3]|uniref:BamA/TamA family outer membrane protein n=1 Tax=Parvularcula mediterranea TaxID=2732508 RepID=A0A7Y3W469_9PROT|nr:BamA/TamA family outer membrane protein [Parvularcula mediterranea]NNU14947.1 BamA/TamA family outer membrane protein [Parvularcula mediterranea]
MTFVRYLLLALVAALFLPAYAAAQGLEVKVTLQGLSKEQTKELRPVSSLARKPQKYTALAPVRRAANSDAQALLQALQSKGFYAATVQPEVDRDGTTVNVRFDIEPGQLFQVTRYVIDYRDEQAEGRPQTLGDAGIATSGSPTGANLHKIEAKLLEHLWNSGYLSAEIRKREVRSDFSQGTATAYFAVRSGPKARYGEVRVVGADRTEPDYVRQYRPFEDGEIAKREDLDEYRERLVETSLFNEVEVTPQLPEEAGTTDVLVRVSERKHRTLGGGVSFATDIGPSVNAYWENRNFLKRGETLRASILSSAPLQEGTASFRKDRPRLPGFYLFSAVLRNEDTEAFNAQTVQIGGSLAKQWFKRNLTTQGGIALQYSDIAEDQCILQSGVIFDPDEETSCEDLMGTFRSRTETFQAVSFPMSVVWNNQKEPLDPQGGFIARALVTPYVGTEDFQRIELAYVDRIFWGARDGGTLAGRVRLGSLQGADRAAIPATERFYAGGGGSLRGYGFQEASPIDPFTGDNLGGASIAEFNVELRQHVSEALELAIFSDFGGAFEDNLPSFDNMLYAAGLGIRYHTPIGPIRVDAAFPLDRREVFIPDTIRDENLDPDLEFEDSRFEIYIGLGQPF